MFTRLVELRTKSGKARELCTTINEKIIPILRKQNGFVEETVLVSTTEPDHVVAISYWKTREDAERYNREDYPKVTQTLQHLFDTMPTVRTFDVDTSTTHRIAAGKAA